MRLRKLQRVYKVWARKSVDESLDESEDEYVDESVDEAGVVKASVRAGE